MKNISRLITKDKFKFLKDNYNDFYFIGSSFKLGKQSLSASFRYKCGDTSFLHKISFKFPNNIEANNHDVKVLVDNLGVIELFNYWKAFCSENIFLSGIYLNKEQKNFWKKVLRKGMSQYFYDNKISRKKVDSIDIIPLGNKKFHKIGGNFRSDKFLVSMGGGKDSIASLELTKSIVEKTGGNWKNDIFLFSVNPTKIVKDVIKTSKIKNAIFVSREIDKIILELNKKGFLNGHIPFTGVLSFASLPASLVENIGNVIFSAEKSANECNVVFDGMEINHQWSKTSEFQKIFKKYIRSFIPGISYQNYFENTLEIDIAKIFVLHPQYFSVFSSCNSQFKLTAKKSNKRWCCKCPKCLFVFIILYPFLNEKEMISIFGQNMFGNKGLRDILDGLIGKKVKPFECVGTRKEVLRALDLCLEKIEKENRKLPYLISYYKKLKYNKIIR